MKYKVKIITTHKLRFTNFDDEVLINQDKISEIIEKKHYSGYVLKLLWFFMSITEYNNRIKYYSQAEISKKINMAPTSVSTAIRILDNDGIIKKDGRDWYLSEELLIK